MLTAARAEEVTLGAITKVMEEFGFRGDSVEDRVPTRCRSAVARGLSPIIALKGLSSVET